MQEITNRQRSYSAALDEDNYPPQSQPYVVRRFQDPYFQDSMKSQYSSYSLESIESRSSKSGELVCDADAKTARAYQKFRLNNPVDEESDPEDLGVFQDFNLNSDGAREEELEGELLNFRSILFRNRTSTGSEKLQRKLFSNLSLLEETYLHQKGEYERAFRNLFPSLKTTSCFMDRDTIQAQIECTEFAEDVLDSSIQLLQMYLQPLLTKKDEDRVSFVEKCREVFSFVSKLERDLPHIFNFAKNTDESIGIHRIIGDINYRKDKISYAKLLARIAYIRIKEKESDLVLKKEKQSELVHCFKSLFEPLQKEIHHLLQDRKIKGQKFFVEKEDAKERRLQKNVAEIFSKIEEVDLKFKLMCFDIPIEEPLKEEILPTSSSQPLVRRRGMEGVNALSESQREEVLVLQRRCATTQDAYCRAKEQLNLPSEVSLFWGCGGTVYVEEGSGLKCIKSVEQYLNSCSALLLNYLDKIDLMSDLEMERTWTDCINRVTHIEQVMNETFLVLDIFKKNQQRRIHQRNGWCVSFSSQMDGLISQIEEKKAFIMAQVVCIILKKMEICYKISLKKYPRFNDGHIAEKKQCLNFFRDKHAEIYDLLEGRALPSRELLRRVTSILQSVTQFESNLWIHNPTV